MERSSARVTRGMVFRNCSMRSIVRRVSACRSSFSGTILATGVTYDNRFCSIIAVENRRIAHWRDYMDSLAAWKALTAR